METNREKIRLDTITLSLFILLLGVGFATLLSASYFRGELYKGDPYFYVASQGKKLLLAVIAMVVIYFTPTRIWRTLAIPMAAASLLLLLLAFVPGFRENVMNTGRWIKIAGVRLQPSEIAKIGVVVYMARSLADKGELARGFSRGFLPSVLVLLLFGSLIVYGMDLGGAVVMAGIVLAMAFASGLKKVYVGLFVLLLGIGVCYFVAKYAYRIDRIAGWLDPEADPAGTGYAILHSFFAFANGGLHGMGPGAGIEKQFYIPEVHTDYIFAVVGEELGFAGVVFVCGLFLALVARGLLVARSAADLFDFHLAVGATLIVGIPAFVNMGVTLSLWPSKGLALPFFSYGGSNLVVSCAAAAMLLRVAAQGTANRERVTGLKNVRSPGPVREAATPPPEGLAPGVER
ncbi:MAG: putative lipid II flippase FtsW [Deltaproteobacteria bacterium]|jgi:cell division protein FtsW|nr:putative lipid II flippase FtsW [Deltaproteobacteria bacterium]